MGKIIPDFARPQLSMSCSVESELYHQKFSFTRKWEDCGDCLTCEELVGVTNRK